MTLPESHEDHNTQLRHGLCPGRGAPDQSQVAGEPFPESGRLPELGMLSEVELQLSAIRSQVPQPVTPQPFASQRQSAQLHSEVVLPASAFSKAPAGSTGCLPCDAQSQPGDGLAAGDGLAVSDDTADSLAVGQLEEVLQSVVGERDFQQWFTTRCRIAVDGDRLQVFVPNPFLLKWMSERFRSELGRVASQLLGPSGNVQFEVDAALATSVESSGDAEASAMTHRLDQPHSEHSQIAQSFQQSVSASVRSAQRRVASSDAASPDNAAPRAAGVRSRRRFRGFETFISGECNDIAAMAAMQVAGQPGDRYNPLFVYGATGTGKTHLLEAIYSEVRRKDPTAQVMYLTSEGFTNYFTSALRERTVPSFRQKFRNVDVLLIDNIEFLDNKRATQEEFLHTIVQVIEHGGQVVISSDRHPRMLTRQREELTTRFLSGLVCRMDVPDEETRHRMVAFFLKDLQGALSPEAVDFVVRRCKRGVREIQGAINQLESCFRLTKKRISGSRARQLLGSLQEESRRLVRISDVEKVVCEAFGISAVELRSSSRRRLLAVPRAIAMYLSRRMTGSAYREIGLYFGGRDHSTVVAAEKKVSRQISEETVVGQPTASRCRTVSELTDYLEQQLHAVAS